MKYTVRLPMLKWVVVIFLVVVLTGVMQTRRARPEAG